MHELQAFVAIVLAKKSPFFKSLSLSLFKSLSPLSFFKSLFPLFLRAYPLSLWERVRVRAQDLRRGEKTSAF